ncbi:MAG TPA: DUF3443 family protein [Terriglobales bacterium]|nr:DUF3443 family protein [Terriglobales bacterium]
MIIRRFAMLLVAASVVLMAACGGGGGSTPTSTITGVTVSCSPSTVSSGQTSQCSATVTGTGNFSTAVTWSTSAGSISASGLLTAPIVNSSTQVSVSATSTQDTSKTGSATVTVNPTTSSSNVAPIVVDAGPDPSSFTSTNVAFVTVTVCIPGTNTCQTIDHVQVDTGSSGLRLLSSASGGEFNLSLPPENVNGNPLDECLVFLDGFVWGPVYTATVTVAGETASNVPVQVMIPSSSSPSVPSTCSNQTTGPNEGVSLSAFGANGIIGVGLFQNDCGDYCVSQGSSCNGSSNAPCIYYQCSGSNCTPANVAISQQVPNPVTLFATDNNGVLIQFPSVPDGGSPTVSGSLIFGIGTESNNGLGNAQIFAVPDSGNNPGNMLTTFNNQQYQAFVDSGSNGLFFLDSSTTGIPTCSGQFTGGSDWYCPSTSPDNLSASDQGQTSSGAAIGNPVPVNFSIENAANLFNTSNTAFSTLSGPQSDTFDWGLPFFYGRSIFTAIDTMSTPGGTGPYFAF